MFDPGFAWWELPSGNQKQESCLHLKRGSECDSTRELVDSDWSSSPRLLNIGSRTSSMESLGTCWEEEFQAFPQTCLTCISTRYLGESPAHWSLRKHCCRESVWFQPWVHARSDTCEWGSGHRRDRQIYLMCQDDNNVSQEQRWPVPKSKCSLASSLHTWSLRVSLPINLFIVCRSNIFTVFVENNVPKLVILDNKLRIKTVYGTLLTALDLKMQWELYKCDFST